MVVFPPSVPFFCFNSQTKSLMPCPKGMTRTGCRRVWFVTRYTWKLAPGNAITRLF